MDLKGRVVAVTGAARGIGRAAALAFAAAGARVALLGRPGPGLERAAAEAGGLAVACDVAQWPQVEAAAAQVAATLGRLDVWVNNAGTIAPIAPLAEAAPQDWAAAVAVNLTGTFHGMRAAIPHMRAQQAGTILNLSSGAAAAPYEGWSAYCAAKAGAAMLTRSGHLEEARHGLRILGLSPGTVATGMQRAIAASGVNPVSRIPWEDHVPPEWPARALVWMCGPAADPWLGRDVSLRDPEVRRAAGLVP